MPNSPLNYSDVADMYSAFTDAHQTTETLPEYAARLNTETGSNAFDAAVNDNVVKQASYGLDRIIRATGLPQVTGAIGEGIGTALGQPEAGRQAGEGLPRGFVNFAPMLALSLIPGGQVPALAYVGGAGLSGLLAGADTYTETGSVGAGLIAGSVTAGIGPVAHFGGELALHAVGAPLAQAGGLRVANTVGQKLAQYGGGQAAALSAFEIAGEAQSYVEGQGLYNPLDPAHLVGTAIGQLPFMIADLPRVLRKAPDVKIPFMKTDGEAQDAVVAQKNLAIPKPVPPEFGPQPLSTAIMDMFAKRAEVLADKGLSQEERQKKLDDLNNIYTSWMSGENPVAETVEEGNLPPTQTRVGVPLSADVVTLKGTIDYTNKNDQGQPTSHFMSVDDADAEGFAGKRLMFPEHPSNNVVDLGEGKFQVTVPKRFVKDMPWKDQMATPKVVEGDKNPDLPTQSNWHLAEEQRRFESANRQLQVLGQQAAALYEVDIKDLNDFYETTKKADDIKAAAGDVTKTTDAEMRVELATELEAAKGDMKTATTKVAKKRVAKAANLVAEKQKVTKRTLKTVETLNKAGLRIADLEKRAAQAQKRSEDETVTLTPEEHADLQDLAIIKRHLKQSGYSEEGRSGEVPIQIMRAYSRWLDNVREQVRIYERATGKQFDPTDEAPVDADKLQKERAKSLEGLFKSVANLYKIPKTLTGGKVLKADGKWKDPNNKEENLSFATKEEALVEIEKQKEANKGHADFDNVKPMSRHNDDGTIKNWYLQVRPREKKVGLEELDKKGTVTVPEFDDSVVTTVDGALEALREHDVSRSDMVDVMATKVLAMDEKDVRTILERENLPASDEDVRKFKARVATLALPLAEGDVKIGPKSTDANASFINDWFAEKGIEFETEFEAKEFLEMEPVLREVLAEAHRLTLENEGEGDVKAAPPANDDETWKMSWQEDHRIGQKFNYPMDYLRSHSENALLYLNREHPNFDEVADIKQELLKNAQRDELPQKIVNWIQQENWNRLTRVRKEDFVDRTKSTTELTAPPTDATPILTKREQKRVAHFGLDQSPAEAIKRLGGMFQKGSLSHAVLQLLNANIDLLKGTRFRLVLDKVSGTAYDKNRNTITLTADYLGNKTQDVDLAAVVMHEVLHTMTQKAIDANPNHPMVKELERLRQYAIKQLPPEVRAAFEKHGTAEAYLAHAAGDAPLQFGLEGTPWESILYGLTNVHEFVSEAFSSHDMQMWLKRLKSPESKSTFRRLVSALASYFGKGTDNILYQTISSTTRLFDRQRSILKFEDVINPMLRNEGVVQRDLATRAGFIYAGLEIRPVGSTIEERSASIIDRALHSFNESTQENVGLSYYERRDIETAIKLAEQEQTPVDYTKQLNQDFGVSLQSKVVEERAVDIRLTDAIKQLNPAQLRQYLELNPLSNTFVARAVAKHGLLNLELLTKIDDAARAGILSIDPLNAKAYDEARGKFQTLLDIVDDVHTDNVALARLQSLDPVGFLVTQQDVATRTLAAPPKFPGAAQLAEDMNNAGPLTKVGRTFRNLFMPAWQFAKQYPVTAPVIELAFDHQARVARFLTTHLLPFFSENGELSPAKQKEFEKVTRDKFLTDKIDALIRLRQDKKGLMDYSDPKDKSLMDSVLQGLTPEQRKRALEISDQQTVSILSLQKDVVEHETKIGESALASIIQRQSSLSVGDNRLYAKTMLDAMRMLQDPTTQQKGVDALRHLQTILVEDAMPKFMQFAEKEVERIKSMSEFFEGRPWFATEQRFENFVIRFKRNGKAGSVDGTTLAEARDKMNRLYPGADVLEEIVKQDPNDPNRSYGINNKLLEKLEQSQTAYIEALKLAGVEQSEIDAAQSNSMVASLKREMAANALYKPGSERKGALGRETLPMLKNHFNYVNAVGHALNKRLTLQELWLRSNDPDLRQVPDLRAQAMKHIDNFLAPDSEAGRFLTSTNFYYYLGLNLSSHVIEGAQSMLSHVAQLTAEGSGILGSYNHIFSAAAAIKDWAIGTKSIDSAGRDLSWKNPEHAEIMHRAKLNKEIGHGMWEEGLGSQDQAAINFMRNASGNDGFSLSDLVKKPLAAYKQVTSSIYGIFTHFNARLALIASFDMYRAKGLSFEDAYQKSREFNRTANMQGGRAARPIDLFTTRGQLRTGSMIVNSLQSYQLGMISMFYRYFSHGFGKDVAGLTTVDRGNARKAAVQMFATQIAAAGILGLPFVAAGVALLEQLFPDLELKKNLRLYASKALQDDKEANGLLTNIALQGVPSQLGVDVQSRLGIGGNIAGLSEYNGFDPKNILGPTYNLFRNLAVGVSQASSGDVLGGVQQMLPPAYKKAIELYRNSGDIRSPSGQLLLQPTPGEQFAYAIGFRPKRAADVQEADRMLKRSDEIRRREVEQFHQQSAAKVLSGDATGARRDLVARAEADPTFDVRAGARAVAAAVERRTMPEDPRREGVLSGAMDRSNLLSTYSLPKQPPSELERLKLRKAVERSLGVPGAGMTSLTEMRVASMVDQLMVAHPSLTRSQAQKLAESQVTLKPQASLLDAFSD